MLVLLVQELRAGVGTDAYPGGGGRTLLNLPSDLEASWGGRGKREKEERKEWKGKQWERKERLRKEGGEVRKEENEGRQGPISNEERREKVPSQPHWAPRGEVGEHHSRVGVEDAHCWVGRKS